MGKGQPVCSSVQETYSALQNFGLKRKGENATIIEFSRVVPDTCLAQTLTRIDCCVGIICGAVPDVAGLAGPVVAGSVSMISGK